MFVVRLDGEFCWLTDLSNAVWMTYFMEDIDCLMQAL